MMKYKIEKGSVLETLLIPLYGRKMAMDLYPDLFADKECRTLLERIDFDAPPMSGIKARIGALMAATRQYDMAKGCLTYLKKHPNACVVNLGCGLDTTFYQVDNGTAKGYNLDFPDVIQARNECVLLFQSRGCPYTVYSHGEAVPRRETGFRCNQRKGLKEYAENLAGARSNEGCRSIFQYRE